MLIEHTGHIKPRLEEWSTSSPLTRARRRHPDEHVKVVIDLHERHNEPVLDAPSGPLWFLQ